MTREIDLVNIDEMEIILSDGEVVPIERVLEVDDLPLSAVAGPDSQGVWYSIDLSCFGGYLH